MAWKDKEKQRVYQREWYKNNSEKQKKHTMNHQRKIKLWFRTYKNTIQCSRCDENDTRCIDFHHYKDKKLFNISYMVNKGYSINTILKEINKCIPLCANCHRKETLKGPVAQQNRAVDF